MTHVELRDFLMRQLPEDRATIKAIAISIASKEYTPEKKLSRPRNHPFAVGKEALLQAIEGFEAVQEYLESVGIGGIGVVEESK